MKVLRHASTVQQLLLLLAGLLLFAAAEETPTAAPDAANGQTPAVQPAVSTVAPVAACESSYPPYDVPAGTPGWTDCHPVTGGADVRQCTAPCSTPYFKPNPTDPSVRCSGQTGRWGQMVGGCVPTPQNCANSMPVDPANADAVDGWACVDGAENPNIVRKCTADCAPKYAPAVPGRPVTATCSSTTGVWSWDNQCVSSKYCKDDDMPSYPAPYGTAGWTDCNPMVGGTLGKQCRAPCRVPYFQAAEASTPTTSCNKANGQWSSVEGACVPTAKSCTEQMVDDQGVESWGCVDGAESLTIDKICIGTCKQGYTAKPAGEPVTAVCTHTGPTAGEWSHPAAKCVKDDPPGNICYKVPPYQTPAGSIGWSISGCAPLTGNGYVMQCTAPCKQGWLAYPSAPSTNCFESSSYPNGKWEAVKGACYRAGTCNGDPTLERLEGTTGWTCRYTGLGTKVKVCSTECKSGWTPSPSDGAPDSVCDSVTGWEDIRGECIKGPTVCGSRPDRRKPPHSKGWDSSNCQATGVGFPVTIYCHAECERGYVGKPHAPSSQCNTRDNVWTRTEGVCVPATKDPCYGYPGGSKYYQRSQWPSICSQGLCHGCTCEAKCSYGTGQPHAPRSKCVNGKWGKVTGVCV